MEKRSFPLLPLLLQLCNSAKRAEFPKSCIVHPTSYIGKRISNAFALPVVPFFLMIARKNVIIRADGI